jgi:hypothetical protein
MVSETPVCEEHVTTPENGASSYKVKVFRALDDLEELREFWDSRCEDPNADLDFFLVSARCRREIVRPHVIVLYRNSAPVCLLAGRLEDCRAQVKIGHQVIAKPAVRQLFFLQGGLLGDASEENIQILLQELKSCLRRGEADVAELSRIVPKSTYDNCVRAKFGGLHRGHFSPQQEHRWLKLPTSYEEFLNSLPGKHRHEFRRHQKRLATDFPRATRVRCFRSEAEVDELMREVECIAEKTYQRALRVGFQPTEEVVESLRSAAMKGGLRGCILYLNEKPCAFFIGKQYKNSFHGHYMGFDPEFRSYSPGLMILMHSIEDCFADTQRAEQVDLGWGDRHFKRTLCNQSRLDGPMYLYSLSWPSLRLNLVRTVLFLIDLVGRKCLEKSAFLQRVKKSWQTHTAGESAANST